MTTNTEAAPGQIESILEKLYVQDRVVITASLKLANGHFLQPTGFPDIDACIYRDQEGQRRCLVESEQSMSNRLEAVCMKSPGVWVDELKGLPLIAVKNKAGDLLATNLTEPHRIASSYILEGKRDGESRDMRSRIAQRIGLGKITEDGDIWPLDRRADLEKLVFALDPAALLHGFQFIQWKFVGLRHTRLLHARLEAELPEEFEVHYGMVKTDVIEPDQEEESRKKTNKGQSMAAKSRIVPKNITATFEIDMLGLKSLSLDEDRKKFLLGLALWKIGAFLANRASFDPRSRATGPSLRLRADCYLTCDKISWSGNSSTGTTTVTQLMGAKPTGLGQAQGPSFTPGTKGNEDGKGAGKPKISFRDLVKEILPNMQDEASHAEEKVKSLYDGPLVEVIYEPKPKQAKKRGREAQQSDADDAQADEQE